VLDDRSNVATPTAELRIGRSAAPPMAGVAQTDISGCARHAQMATMKRSDATTLPVGQLDAHRTLHHHRAVGYHVSDGCPALP